MFRRFDLLFGLAMALAHTAVAGTPPAPKPTPVPSSLQSGVHPPKHLRQAIAKAASGGTVNVCIAGDSTSLMTPAGVNPTEGLWYHLQRQLISQNPGVTFSFLNYGIPGTVFGDFLSTSAYTKAQAYGLTWYASSGATWTQYVLQGACDILFLNWGVNDAYIVNPDTLYTFLNGIGAYTTHPAIVFITNAAANRAAGLPYSNPQYQAGYIATPSLIRAVAEMGAAGFTTAMTNPVPPVGLIDIGRWFQQAVLGVDYTTQKSTNIVSKLPSSITVNTSTPYVFPKTDGDFYLKLSFPGQLAAFTNTTTINITVAAMDGGTGTQTAAVVFTTGGAYLQFNNGSRINVSSLQSFTGTDVTIEVSVNQNFLTLTAGNKTLQRKVIKATAPFTPKLSVVGASAPASITANVLAYSVGTAQAYNKVLTTADAYGPTVASAQVSQASAAGTNVLTFVAVPAAVSAGMAVADVDIPAAIPTGTTVLSRTATTVTLSANAASPGVGSTDNIVFGTQPGLSGGNGINHDASLALNYVYGSAIRATDLCLICYTPNGMAAKSWDTQAPASGATITTTYGLRELTVNPAADIAALTVVLPPAPADRDDFNFVSTKNIATLTINGGTTAVTANTRLVWRYNTSLTAWVRWQ